MTQKPSRVAMAILIGFLLAAIFGALLPPFLPTRLEWILAKPSLAHPLGCDAFGVDLGLRLLRGAWRTVWISAVAAVFSLGIGLLVAVVATLPRAVFATAARLITTSFLAFPGLLLALLIAALLPHSETSIVLSLVASSWAARAQLAMSLLAEAHTRAHVEAATALGASPLRVFVRHVWPTVMVPYLTQGLLSVGHFVLGEAGLSFLGLGGTTENHSWGRLIAMGREYLVEAPHLSLIPGVCFVAVLLSVQALGESLLRRRTRPSLLS